jgi:hypothetical protein
MLCVVERARRITLDFALGWERLPGTAQIRRDILPTGWRSSGEQFSPRASVAAQRLSSTIRCSEQAALCGFLPSRLRWQIRS